MDSLDNHVSTAHPQRSSSPGGSDDGDASQKKAPARKRTKTGCLTCRKRRIKCDEGKPTCNNCVRSKRQCEGYNQRVIFKDPLGAFAGAPYGPVHYPQPSPEDLLREQQLSLAQQRASSSLQIIAPKPPTYHQHLTTHQFNHFYPGQSGLVPPVSSAPTPNRQGPRLQPSKFTFFPPTTADAFAQGQVSRDLHRSPQDGSSKIPHAISSPQPNLQTGQSGTFAQFEPSPQDIDDQNIDWSYDYLDDDDDASMADSEDEYMLADDDFRFARGGMEVATASTFGQKYQMFGTHTRTFSTYGAETVLATYDPSPINSPLTDRHIAAVFWHFMNVTGPTMSLYERYAFDPTNAFRGQAIKSKQNIWAYSLPVMSFSHPALLQAMLALASLQIAKLQRVPPTASLKHYHLALRRIAKNVSRPARRTQTANLAATLILAFYEVWNSDHDKWVRHLWGARWIIKEIPLSEMTRAIMAIRMQKRRDEMEQSQYGHHFEYPAIEDIAYLYRDWDLLDVSLLSTILGYQVSYDELGMLPEDLSSYPKSRNIYTEKDIEKYETLSDLFWWYGKMDVYSSILGGTRPSLELSKWMQCPPRAPIGRLDAIYGTYDYLTLLLARLTNFVSRDLARKREAMKTKGSSNWPPPGMFPGMMPASEKVTPPMGFSPPQEDASSSPSNSDHIDIDLSTRTAEACHEWERIKEAFEEIKAHFGPDFDELAPDVYPASDTPFGPSAHFRTYTIAGIWMNYYMGLIVLHRAHPTMPPAAMLAAGMTAKTTMPWTFEIGRIAAGLEENISRRKVVSTLLAAALIESAFSLFVAGVQYQSDDQRHWLIRRLRAIANLTGWQSAHQIADGCQSAWSKAAQLGRGPPYRPEPEVDDDDQVTEARIRQAERKRQHPRPPDVGPPGLSWVWGNPRRLDRRVLDGEHFSATESSPTVTDARGKKKIVLAKAEKAFFALGLLTVEQDLENLDLDSADPVKNEEEEH